MCVHGCACVCLCGSARFESQINGSRESRVAWLHLPKTICAASEGSCQPGNYHNREKACAKCHLPLTSTGSWAPLNESVTRRVFLSSACRLNTFVSHIKGKICVLKEKNQRPIHNKNLTPNPCCPLWSPLGKKANRCNQGEGKRLKH